MSKFTNRYIVVYITILVVLIATVLSVVSLSLQPLQEKNRNEEKITQILNAAGYYEVAKDTAIHFFNQIAQRDSAYPNREVYRMIYANGTIGRVIYVNGKGLWGPIWGYVALDESMREINGVVFAHKSETPGLGAKIVDEAFTAQFREKRIVDEQGNFVSVQVVKGVSPITEEHRVDAISGATITSKAVGDMLYSSLKEVIE